MAAFTTTVQVRFGHVDPAGIVYFPRIYDYIHEVFEEVWERHVDERYYRILSVDRIGFPLVHSEVDFKSPLRFGDRAQVSVTCYKLGRSSLGLRYRFSVDGRECVDARMVTACVDLATSKSFEMPERYRAAFEKIREAGVRIRDVINRGWPVFSFEFFPPKTDEGAKGLMHAVLDLNEVWKPDFVSVTYGAGGGTRERTIEVVTRLQGELGIRTMAHLTCVGTTREELRGIVDRLVESGIKNILALRGDAPAEQGTFKPVDGGFAHATELIGFLADDGRVDIGGACYPEKHVESGSLEEDVRWARVKVEKGAGFLITQLFFDNKHYFDFVAKLRAEGIRVPVLPGIMPITNVAQVERFTKMCGATIPPELAARLARVKDDPALVMATGIEHAIKQCRNLLERGAPGLHFYTLNKSYATRCILAAVRKD